MKILYLIPVVVFVIFNYGCKSGNQNDSASTSDTATMGDNNTTTDSAVMSEYSGGFMGIMHQTMMQTDTMKMKGDPDYDFASMMQMHHKGGIAMVNEEIQNGSDTSTISLAKKIKDSQESDLKELQKYTSGNTPGQSNNDFLQEMKSQMQKSKEEMNNNMNMSGNFDKDFTSLMTMHHNHGIEMAKLEVKYGKNTELKALAKKMVAEQEKEKKQMENLKIK